MQAQKWSLLPTETPGERKYASSLNKNDLVTFMLSVSLDVRIVQFTHRSFNHFLQLYVKIWIKYPQILWIILGSAIILLICISFDLPRFCRCHL